MESIRLRFNPGRAAGLTEALACLPSPWIPWTVSKGFLFFKIHIFFGIVKIASDSYTLILIIMMRISSDSVDPYEEEP